MQVKSTSDKIDLEQEHATQITSESTLKENFLKGCFYDVNDKAFKEIEKERTAKMKAEIRDFEQWEWDPINETYEGVTLKHAFDMILQY